MKKLFFKSFLFLGLCSFVNEASLIIFSYTQNYDNEEVVKENCLTSIFKKFRKTKKNNTFEMVDYPKPLELCCVKNMVDNYLYRAKSSEYSEKECLLNLEPIVYSIYKIFGNKRGEHHRIMNTILCHIYGTLFNKNQDLGIKVLRVIRKYSNINCRLVYPWEKESAIMKDNNDDHIKSDFYWDETHFLTFWLGNINYYTFGFQNDFEKLVIKNEYLNILSDYVTATYNLNKLARKLHWANWYHVLSNNFYIKRKDEGWYEREAIIIQTIFQNIIHIFYLLDEDEKDEFIETVRDTVLEKICSVYKKEGDEEEYFRAEYKKTFDNCVKKYLKDN